MTEQDICFKCAIKPNKGLGKEQVEFQSCEDCKRRIDPKKCKDCGQVMVFCKIADYYHSTEPRPYKCQWFVPKKGV